MDDIIIRGVSGTTANWAFLLDVYLPGCLLPGNGNVGRVIYDDISLDVTASGAIANAVYDAVGVRIKDAPLYPEKVWRALQAKQQEAR